MITGGENWIDGYEKCCWLTPPYLVRFCHCLPTATQHFKRNSQNLTPTLLRNSASNFCTKRTAQLMCWHLNSVLYFGKEAQHG